ncbi:MAG: magnesium chelatase subunit D [Woeseiaceae bacterium]|nr:magnesium chelatase subunit D [Woeseiaceae bacterium]
MSRALPTHDAALVALLLAAHPHGLGGVSLRGMPSPERDDWLAAFRGLLPHGSPCLKVPVNVSEDRLLGGLDFAATVSAKKPVFATGILEAADGGVIILTMAERIPDAAASIIGEALDRRTLLVERDGVTRECRVHYSVVALDEGIDDDERIAAGLAERIAFRLNVRDLQGFQAELDDWDDEDVLDARQRWSSVQVPDAVLQHFSQAAAAFGITSLRGDLFMLNTARTLAALAGDSAVTEAHAATAARLVLPQRATRVPAEAEPPPPPDTETQEEEKSRSSAKDIPDDILVDAVLAALPPDLLDQLAGSMPRSRQGSTGGRGGPATRSRMRGRPVGVEATRQVGGARLNILATLKAAAPWQSIRRRDERVSALELRPSDLHITRYQDRVETTTIFVVDASGSQAAQRLAEVKGAIELLLNDCYVRRDQVALIAFRKDTAEVLLEPTRALARVKRSLSALPGGGGTPLASGLDAARQLADSVSRQGRTAAIVLMTDGRANVARDTSPGAEKAEHDAMNAAKLLRATGLRSLLVDTSRRPKPRARKLADAMGAGYVALPNADASRISGTVQRRLAS